MRQRIDIPLPIGGVNRNWAFGTQPSATVRDGPNMRSIDPVTGRTRPSQRPGTVQFLDGTLGIANPGGGPRIQNLTPITYDVPTSTYGLLGIDSDDDGIYDDDPCVEEWRASASSGRSFVAVAVEPGGNAIALDDQGTFERYSSDGERVDSGTFPKAQSEVMVKRLVRDIQGGLLGAAYIPGGTASRVFRMRFVEDQGWVLHWSLSLVGTVKALAGDVGNVYVAVDKTVYETGAEVSEVHLYAQGLTSQPEQVFVTSVPNPVSDLTLGIGGAFYVTCPENPERDTGGAGFGASVVSWTPRSIEDQTRIYFWWDASTGQVSQTGGGFPNDPPTMDGDAYPTLGDVRASEVEYSPSDFGQRRPLLPPLDSGGSPLSSARDPKYTASAFALPGMHFGQDSEITVRETLANPAATDGTGGTPKASETSSLKRHGTVFPGYTDAIFTTYMVVRCVPSTTVEVLLQQNNRQSAPPADQAEYGVLINSDETGASDEGKVFLDVKGVTEAGAAGTDTFILPGTFDGDSTNTVLLTFQHSGNFADTSEWSCFRVNGSQVDKFKLSLDESWSESSGEVKTIFGYRERDPGSADDELYTGTTHDKFTGYIGEVVTVLGEHDGVGGIHNVVPDSPNDADAGSQSGTVSVANRNDAAEMEYVEGYLAHKWGISHLLPQGTTPDTADGDGFYPNHPFGEDVPGGDPTNDSGDTSYNLLSGESIVAKYWADGSFAWAHAGSAMGRGVAFYRDTEEEESWVYSVGNDATEDGQTTNGSTNYVCRRIKDLGPGFSVETADGAWMTDSSLLTFDEVNRAPIQVSSDGDVWFHSGLITVGVDSLFSRVERFDAGTRTGATAGERLALHTFVSDFAAEGTRRLNGIAIVPETPTYGPGIESLGQEHLYAVLGDGNLLGVSGELVKLRILKEDRQVGATPRRTKTVGVREGELYVFDRSGYTQPEDVGFAPGALEPLDPSGVDVFSAILFGKVYFVDGQNYVVFDPKGGVNGTVEPWEAEKGSLPRRARLIGAWRGRAVVARSQDNPYGWWMSRVLDPLDWNESPDVVTPDQPVTGRTAPLAHDIPDVVNCFIPYSDDLAFFGCDSSIYRLTGDPMQGGQIHLVSDVTGISFGQPWTKDPSGVLYFFGSKGGVWALPDPLGRPQNITERTLERDLQDLDRSAARVEMQWNYRYEGLDVFVISRTDGTGYQSWFWDKKNNAWWPTNYAQRVTATAVFDGDAPADRAVLLGGEDAYVRTFSDTAKTDDDERIDSSLLIGPVSGPGMRAMLCQIDALLARDQGRCTFEVFMGEDPERLGDPVMEGVFKPGFNPPVRMRRSGNQFWVRLRNATTERWALEALALYVAPKGRRRTVGA